MNITAIIAAVSASLSFWAAWQIQGVRMDHLKAGYTNEKLAREQSARQQLADAQAKVTAAQDAAKLATDRVRMDAAGAGRAAVGLRDALAGAVRTAATDLQACTGQVDALSKLLAASTDLSRRIAAEADEWAVDRITLQEAWPK